MASEEHRVVGWKPIESATCYEISTDGEVRRVKPGRGRCVAKSARGGWVGNVMKHVVAKSGYPCVNLSCDDGRYRVFNIHALLGQAFIRRASEAHFHVAHADGDKLNFKLSNLNWKTPKENNADKLAHGTHVIGDRHGNTKIPDALVPFIRSYRGPTRDLQKMLGTSSSTILRIRAGTERSSQGPSQAKPGKRTWKYS